MRARWRSQQTSLVSRTAASAQQNGNGVPAVDAAGPTLVWFKHDLRLDDHPGLAAALERAEIGGGVVTAFVFDPAFYGHLLSTPSGVEGLMEAVRCLRDAIRQKGGELLLRVGPLAPTLLDLAQELGASHIITEDEVEYRWHTAISAVRAELPKEVQLQQWQVDVYADEPYCNNFREFQRRRGQQLQPLDPPQQLPPPPSGLDAGQLPAAADFAAQVAQAAALRQHPGFAQQTALSLDSLEPWRAPIAAKLVGGESRVRAALDAYLRPTTSPSSSNSSSAVDAELVQQVAETTLAAELPSCPGGSFPAVFGQWLALGLLSRRRVAQLAQQAQQNQRQGQLLAAFQPSPVGVAAAQKWAEAADFHWHLASTDRIRDTQTGEAPRHWRWRGALADYYTAEPGPLGESHAPQRPDAPAVLLVHGFGAFGEQWRGQIQALTRAGYQVFAPTFPGYGRSEKPAVAYSAELWRDYLRDFVLEIVRKPVVVAGNSIGGYIGAALAADYSPLVSGLVLLNSAGQIDPAYQPPADGEDVVEAKSPPPRLVIEALSRGLFLFLERSISWNLARLYPGDPTNADEWLADEIYRAVCDPGALGVFQSVFYLPKPRPLSHLVGDKWRGPTLVLQGALDPLNKAEDRARALEACCSNVEVELLQAGHCPHDEAPAAVNEKLLQFLERRSIRSPGSGEAAEAALAA